MMAASSISIRDFCHVPLRPSSPPLYLTIQLACLTAEADATSL